MHRCDARMHGYETECPGTSSRFAECERPGGYCSSLVWPSSRQDSRSGSWSAKALIQERRLAERQLQETLAAAADSAGTRLQSELKEWQQAADNIGTFFGQRRSGLVVRACARGGARTRRRVVPIGSLDRPAGPSGPDSCCTSWRRFRKHASNPYLPHHS